MTKKVLVTGVTGNVGRYVAKELLKRGIRPKGAVSDPAAARNTMEEEIELVAFDFHKTESYAAALEGVDKVFLVRPPAIGDPAVFAPFIQQCKEKGIRHIVFLSLLGIERNPFPPHYKIERLIKASGIPYTFIRPSFFMQNLNTTHREDIKERGDIFVPAGRAKVSFIDTRDIGEACAAVLADTERHGSLGYTLTGPEAITYYEAAEQLSAALGKPIRYSNPSAGAFRKEMLARGLSKDFVNVMAVLYMTTRFGMAKRVTNELEELLGRPGRSFRDYAADYAAELM